MPITRVKKVQSASRDVFCGVKFLKTKKYDNLFVLYNVDNYRAKQSQFEELKITHWKKKCEMLSWNYKKDEWRDENFSLALKGWKACIIEMFILRKTFLTLKK